MKDIFELNRNFIYNGKSSYGEYEHKGINVFLESMYKVALQNGVITFETPLTAFNSAYYIATALSITPYINLRNMDKAIDTALDRTLAGQVLAPQDNDTQAPWAVFPPHAPLAHRILVMWMVYAILYLQKDKTIEMEEYLQGYFLRLKQMGTEYSEEEETWERIFFVSKFPDMIERCQEQYTIDLYPNLKASNLTDQDWLLGIKSYDEDTILLLISFFRTKEEQHSFLDWMMEMYDKHELPF